MEMEKEEVLRMAGEEHVFEIPDDGERILVAVHETLESCIAAYFDCPESEILEREGHWEGYDSKGEPYRLTTQEVVENCTRKGVWGFLEDKVKIHVWVDTGKATFADALKLIAHERGHMLRPYHKTTRGEEMKAGRYEDVADFAYLAATVIFGNKEIST